MDLKFSFGGASPDQHDHGGAPSGIPLPFPGTSAPASNSSELDVTVRLDTSGERKLVAEVITGDGVTYSRGEVAVQPNADAAALSRAARSAISRAVAGLEGPLATAITSIELRFDGAPDALGELGLDASAPAVTEELQARLGISAGTPIRAS